MQEKDVLQSFGLSAKEAQLYVLLLETGSAKAGTIMRKMGIYSKTAYELLNKLIEKGLVGYTLKSNVRYYQASDPEKFTDMLSENKNKLDEIGHALQKVMPALRQKNQFTKQPQEVNVFIGNQGMKYIFDDMLRQKKDILVLGGGGKFKTALGAYSEIWHKKRAKEKIPLKILWSQKLSKRRKHVENLPLTKIRLLPKEFDNPAPAVIYDEKVVITIWSEKPIAMLIRSREVSDSFRNYFNMLWNIGKR